MAVNSIEVTVSGYVNNTYELPDDSVWESHFCDYHFVAYKYPKSFSVNLLNVETFREISYPILEHKIELKKISWLKRLVYAFICPDKESLYNIEHKQIGVKTVTWLKMRSGDKYMVDESAMCIQNALDACVWNADAECFK